MQRKRNEMARLSIFLLGSFRVALDGEPVTGFVSDKARALLAFLAVEAERSHRREALVGLLWPEYPERSARASLRNVLANVRQVIGDREADPPFLCIARQTIQFNPQGDAQVDVRTFTEGLELAGASPQSHPGTIHELEAAVALHQGGFLEGFSLPDSPAFEEWALLKREQLQRQALAALGRLAGYYERRGEYERALQYAWRRVEVDPYRGVAQRGLMRLLALSGQREAALVQYETFRRLLAEEMGVAPTEETTWLYKRIEAGELRPPAPGPRVEVRVQRPAFLEEAAEREDAERPVFVARAREVGLLDAQLDVPAGPAISPQHNLPVQPTPFVEREAVLAEIKGHLDDPACRLLTLVGPGGSGKTRLALEAAAAQLDNYPHGVYFVSLAPLESAEAIVPTVAKALGFSFYAEAGGPAQDRLRQGMPAQQQLLDYLRPKGMLLIMDNFEHLLEGTGLVTEILRAAPGVKILATSRARLNVGGEHRLRIAGMIYPDEETAEVRSETFAQRREGVAQYSAVKLFLQGARRARPSFELTGENLSGVVQVCRLVDGLPLAIRLAAAWVEVITPAEIAVEIGRSLDFLETERRDVPERQRSMRAAFDHSWNLLSEQEREVFQRLSVFRGGFIRDAAHRVIGGSLRELRALVDRSLLEWDPAPSTSLPSMALGTGRTGGRYNIHELLRQYGEERLGEVPAEKEATRDRHCAYYAEFLRQREAHLMGREQRRALAEIEAEIENLRTGWDWAVAWVKIGEIDRSLVSLAEFYRIRAWLQEGEEAFGRAAQRLAAKRSETLNRQSRFVLGKVLMHQGRFCDPLGLAEQGRELLHRSLAIFRDLGAQREMAYALCYLEDEPSWQEALAIFEEIGDRRGIALSLGGLAEVARGQGEYGVARQLFQESLVIFRELGNQEGIAHSLHRLGYLAWILGEWEVARGLYQEGLMLFQKISDQQGVARSLFHLGLNAHAGFKEYGEAKQLLRESLAIYEEIGHVHGMAWVLSELSELANILGEYAEAIQLAQESVPLARRCGDRGQVTWCLRVLGRAACGLGDLQGAKGYFHQALEMAMTEQAIPWALAMFDGIAMFLAREGERERALELLALAAHHPASAPILRDRAAPLVAELEAELPPQVVTVAQERGQARDLDATLAELLVELGEESSTV